MELSGPSFFSWTGALTLPGRSSDLGDILRRFGGRLPASGEASLIPCRTSQVFLNAHVRYMEVELTWKWRE